MDDRPSASSLQYGHLGTVFYLPDTQTWDFARCPREGPSIQLREESPATTLEQTTRLSHAVRSEGPRRTEYEKEHALLRQYPELASSLQLVEPHNRLSRVITSRVKDFDPLISARLAVGKAVPADGLSVSRSAIPIVVIASGDPATSIALIPIEPRSKDLPGGQSVLRTLPYLNYRDAALWSCPYGPVQQICFAESIEEDNIYFAIRFSHVTTIFRPLHHRTPLDWSFGTKGFNPEPQQKARLSPNPLLEIPISLTGGHYHVDVTFNPWYQQQLAIIDRCGNWSVWDIPTKQRRTTNLVAERGPCGSLADAVRSSNLEAKEKDQYDGWASISWVGNVHTLLVCDRRNLNLCILNTHPPKQSPVNLDLLQGSEWILDLSRSISNPFHIFVLTTARIIWLDVLTDGNGSQTASILLSWKHFRDIEDTSLRLTQVTAQNDLSVILFSRFNGLAQGFRFCISTDEPSIPISVSDPFIFPIPDIVYDVHQPKNNGKSDRFSHILLKESGNLETSHETVHPESAVIKFIGETTDLKLVEAFNCLSFDDQPRQANSSQNNSIVPRKSLRSKIKSSYRVDDVNFVVEDMEDLGTRSNPQTEQTRVLPGPLYRSPELPERIEPWMSWHTYVFHGSPETLSDIDVKSHQIQSFDDWIGPAIIGLQSRVFDGKTFMTCQTLLEALGDPPSLDAIDSNAGSFDRLLRAMDAAPSSQQHYRLSALPLPISVTSLLSVATPARPSDMSLTALYDSVVFDWLSPLAEQVPTKVRIFKERMIRSLVTEILFSRISLVPVRIDEEKIVNVEGMDSNDIDSTVGSQQGTGESIPLQEILLTSQDINSTSALTSPHELSESAFRVLRRYTTVHSQVPPNKRVLTTISHWEPGTDPSNYNWDKTVRELKGKQSQSDQQSAARRRQRREERKRRQSGIIEAQVLSQPSTPRVAESVRMWGSQPDRVSGATSSVEPGIWSSQAVEEEIPLTQVERGVFGGREASRKTVVKERKKRRAAGF